LTAGIPILTSELDAKVWLLNCENGTIDLRTDELRKHRRGDLVTRMAPVKDDSEVEAPEFAMFLERILPSEALRRLGKRAIGYSATGEYARQAAPDLLLINTTRTLPSLRTSSALVASVEVYEGRCLAGGLVKQLTGRDLIKARRMREDFWQFEPTHIVFLATKYRPELRGTDLTIWRRISEGKTTREALRALKRYIVRAIWWEGDLAVVAGVPNRRDRCHTRCRSRQLLHIGASDHVWEDDLIEAQMARLSPEAKELWEQLEFLREAIPDQADESRIAREYEIMERIFELPMPEQFGTSRLAELVGGLRGAEEAQRRGESGDEHPVRSVINAAMLKDRQEGCPIDSHMTLDQAIARLKG
jgi:hypothetical protein